MDYASISSKKTGGDPHRSRGRRAELARVYFAGVRGAYGKGSGPGCRRWTVQQHNRGHTHAHTRQAITRPQYTRLYTRPIYRPYSIDTHRTQPQQHPAPGPPGTPARRAFSFCPLTPSTRPARHTSPAGLFFLPFNARGHARIHAAFTTRIKREAQRPAGRPDGEKVLCAFLSVCGFRSPKIFLGFKNFFGVPPPVTPKRRGGAKNLFTNCLHEK